MSPPNPKLPRTLPRSFHTAAHPRPHDSAAGARAPILHGADTPTTAPLSPHSRPTCGPRAHDGAPLSPHSPPTRPDDGACRPQGPCCTARPHLLACPAGSWCLARQKTERKGEHSMSGTWGRNEMAEGGGSETGTKTPVEPATSRARRGALPKSKIVRYDQRPVGSDFSVIYRFRSRE